MERKFKPWRKGKSAKSNKRSSLKQQLRGHQRLLAKLPDTDDERLQELQAKIQALESEINQKQQVIHEKKNAEDSHGRRFFGTTEIESTREKNSPKARPSKS
jgi:TolA-binding protein